MTAAAGHGYITSAEIRRCEFCVYICVVCALIFSSLHFPKLFSEYTFFYTVKESPQLKKKKHKKKRRPAKHHSYYRLQSLKSAPKEHYKMERSLETPTQQVTNYKKGKWRHKKVDSKIWSQARREFNSASLIGNEPSLTIRKETYHHHYNHHHHHTYI